MNLELDSLHGQATVLAALVAISPKLLLGYPARFVSLYFAMLSCLSSLIVDKQRMHFLLKTYLSQVCAFFLFAYI